MNILQANNDIKDVSAELDTLYGKVGSSEREQFRKEAYAYYMGQILQDARKSEKITQNELAKRVGVNKSDISNIENGIVEPGIAMLFRIASALGCTVELKHAV